MTTNIFEALRESHDIQRDLCTRLVRSKAGTAARDEVFKRLKIELEAHAAAEERYLYCPILMDDNGLSPSRHALGEHHEIEELVEELTVKNKSTTSWQSKAKELGHTVRHHLKEEERGFFQQAGKILSDKQKISLASKYLRDLNRMRKKLSLE
jgi:hemerythrin superfamily protein